MKNLSRLSRLKSLTLSTVLAFSVIGCSTGSGDPLTDAQAAYDANQYSAARIHVLSALKENSSDAKANLVFGKILLEMGDGEGAGAAFKKILNDKSYGAEAKPLYAHALLLTGASDKALELVGDPADPTLTAEAAAKSYWVKACALLDLGRPEEALALMETALAKMPKDVDLLALKGKYHLTAGELVEGQRYAALALKAGPDDLEALQLSGRIAMMRQDLKTAETLFAKATKLYPESVLPLFSLAAIYADMGEEEKSRDYFGRILKNAPKHPVALFMLAKLEFEKGNVDAAHEMLQVAGEGVADVPQAVLLGGQIENARGNHEIAIARLKRFLALMPGNAEGIAAIGSALLAVGNGAEAYATVKPAAMRATAPPELLVLAAKLAQQQGDPAANQFAARAKSSGKSDIDSQMKAADAAIKLNDWNGADAVYAKLRASGHGSNPMVLNNSALVALELGDRANAKKFARAALRQAPNDAFILDTLGWILLKQGGDKAEALALIKKAAERAPSNREILGHLAQAYAANGNKVAANKIGTRLKGNLSGS